MSRGELDLHFSRIHHSSGKKMLTDPFLNLPRGGLHTSFLNEATGVPWVVCDMGTRWLKGFGLSAGEHKKNIIFVRRAILQIIVLEQYGMIELSHRSLLLDKQLASHELLHSSIFH